VMEITGICDPNISVYSGFRLIDGASSTGHCNTI